MRPYGAQGHGPGHGYPNYYISPFVTSYAGYNVLSAISGDHLIKQLLAMNTINVRDGDGQAALL
jgi:hypothetical protein